MYPPGAPRPPGPNIVVSPSAHTYFGLRRSFASVPSLSWYTVPLPAGEGRVRGALYDRLLGRTRHSPHPLPTGKGVSARNSEMAHRRCLPVTPPGSLGPRPRDLAQRSPRREHPSRAGRRGSGSGRVRPTAYEARRPESRPRPASISCEQVLRRREGDAGDPISSSSAGPRKCSPRTGRRAQSTAPRARWRRNPASPRLIPRRGTRRSTRPR